VQPHLLNELLIAACRRIAARGIQSSIGLLDPKASFLDSVTIASLRTLAERGLYLHQRHHYPSAGQILAPAAASPIQPCLLGELPTSNALRWSDRELARSEDDPQRY